MSDFSVKQAQDLLSKLPEGDFTIEAHGDGEALYIGRLPSTKENPFGATHGLNIVNLVEPAYQWPAVRDLIVAAPQLLRDLIKLVAVLTRDRAKLASDLVTANSLATDGYVPAARVREVKAQLAEAERESDRWHGLVSRLRTHLNIPYEATHADAPEMARKALDEAEERGIRWALECDGVKEEDIEARVKEICALRRLR